MKTNLQMIQKQDLRDDRHGALYIHSVFHTIQGEGPYFGTPAVFVRLDGCNLQCPMCDTDYTSQSSYVAPSLLLQDVQTAKGSSPTKLIVITGGEPFRQDFSDFALRAVYAGFEVQVETNGTLWFDNFFPCRFSVVCSPKTPVIHKELQKYIKALKYVVRAGEIDEKDGLPTSVLGNGLSPCRPWKGYTGEVYVQPCDEGESLIPGENMTLTQQSIKNLDAAIQSCMKFGYKLGVQAHKEWNLP